jgi:hypothetical protein
MGCCLDIHYVVTIAITHPIRPDSIYTNGTTGKRARFEFSGIWRGFLRLLLWLDECLLATALIGFV